MGILAWILIIVLGLLAVTMVVFTIKKIIDIVKARKSERKKE